MYGLSLCNIKVFAQPTLLNNNSVIGVQLVGRQFLTQLRNVLIPHW